MKSLVPIVVAALCLLAWQAECQYQPEGGGTGLYVTPAYNGDYGGTYVSPAYSGGSFEAPAGTGGATGAAGYSRERGARGSYRYEFQAPASYSTPAFSEPVLGLRVTPLPTVKPKAKSSAGDPNSKPSASPAPVKPSGVSAQQPESSGTSTNRWENPAAPSSPGTNAPSGQGSSGTL